MNTQTLFPLRATFTHGMPSKDTKTLCVSLSLTRDGSTRLGCLSPACVSDLMSRPTDLREVLSIFESAHATLSPPSPWFIFLSLAGGYRDSYLQNLRETRFLGSDQQRRALHYLHSCNDFTKHSAIFGFGIVSFFVN